MYNCRIVAPDVYYVGASERRLERFENMFVLPRGISYNSYLIMGDKTALMDTVDQAVSDVFINNVKHQLGGRTLDYLVIQHVEPDHCAGIIAIKNLYPQVKLVLSEKGLTFLEQFYNDDFASSSIIVKDGDTLDLGGKTLTFLSAAMVHWPEVIVTYLAEDKILFSADAFGSFGSIEGHLFADQVEYERDWVDEARRYYVNIVGRQGRATQSMLAKAGKFEIKIIASLHGLVFRTPKTTERILGLYEHWSKWEAEEPGVVIAYGSMYNNSAQMADRLATLLSERNIGAIRVIDVSKTNASETIAEIERLSHAVFVCNNYNTELYPVMDALLRELVMLNYSNHKVGIMYNMSWGGRAEKIARDILAASPTLEYVGETFSIKSSLHDNQQNDLVNYADILATSIKAV